MLGRALLCRKLRPSLDALLVAFDLCECSLGVSRLSSLLFLLNWPGCFPLSFQDLVWWVHVVWVLSLVHHVQFFWDFFFDVIGATFLFLAHVVVLFLSAFGYCVTNIPTLKAGHYLSVWNNPAGRQPNSNCF